MAGKLTERAHAPIVHGSPIWRSDTDDFGRRYWQAIEDEKLEREDEQALQLSKENAKHRQRQATLKRMRELKLLYDDEQDEAAIEEPAPKRRKRKSNPATKKRNATRKQAAMIDLTADEDNINIAENHVSLSHRGSHVADPESIYHKLTEAQKSSISPLSFLNFPGEVRNAVYELLLPSNLKGRLFDFDNDLKTYGVASYHDDGHIYLPGKLNMLRSLLQTCKQVQAEITSLFISGITLRLTIRHLHLDSLIRFYTQCCEDPHTASSPVYSMQLPQSVLKQTEKLNLWLVLPKAAKIMSHLNLAFLSDMPRLKSLEVTLKAEHRGEVHRARRLNISKSQADLMTSPPLLGIVAHLASSVPEHVTLMFTDSATADRRPSPGTTAEIAQSATSSKGHPPSRGDLDGDWRYDYSEDESWSVTSDADSEDEDDYRQGDLPFVWHPQSGRFLREDDKLWSDAAHQKMKLMDVFYEQHHGPARAIDANLMASMYEKLKGRKESALPI